MRLLDVFIWKYMTINAIDFESEDDVPKSRRDLNMSISDGLPIILVKI